MTFHERARLAMEVLSKQPPRTNEEKMAQVMRIKQQTKSKKKVKSENYSLPKQ
jgi:hypothetical protein